MGFNCFSRRAHRCMVGAKGIEKASRKKVIVFWLMNKWAHCGDTAHLILLTNIFCNTAGCYYVGVFCIIFQCTTRVPAMKPLFSSSLKCACEVTKVNLIYKFQPRWEYELVQANPGNVHCLGLVVQLWGCVSFRCIDESFETTFLHLFCLLEECITFVYHRWSCWWSIQVCTLLWLWFLSFFECLCLKNCLSAFFVFLSMSDDVNIF